MLQTSNQYAQSDASYALKNLISHASPFFERLKDLILSDVLLMQCVKVFISAMDTPLRGSRSKLDRIRSVQAFSLVLLHQLLQYHATISHNIDDIHLKLLEIGAFKPLTIALRINELAQLALQLIAVMSVSSNAKIHSILLENKVLKELAYAKREYASNSDMMMLVKVASDSLIAANHKLKASSLVATSTSSEAGSS
jgi:hypothetical protein